MTMRYFLHFMLAMLLSMTGTAQAAVSYISSSVSESASTTSLNIPKPTGVTTGDFLLAAISSSNQVVSPAPNGWTLINTARTSGGTYLSVSTYYKFVSSGDPSTFNFQIGGTGSMEGLISAFSGVDPTDPIDADGINANNTTSTNIIAQSITTNTSNAYLVGHWARLRGGNDINQPSAFTYFIRDRIGNNTTGIAVNMSGGQLGSAGATGNWTATSSSSVVSIGALIALRAYVDVTPTPSMCKTDFLVNTGALDSVNWKTSVVAGTYTPQVFSVNGTNRLRMNQAAGNQSTMAQLVRYFPGAGNKITVEFDYYVYGGNGADGMTVVFSDASIPAVAGAFGGSLGYAQQSSINGFAGGWLAIGIDEYGNFPNPTEGRGGYPSGWTPPAGANTAAGFYPNNVSVRGSGSNTTGYRLLANSGTLASPIWSSTQTSTRVQRFRILIDHSDGVHAYVKVERDLTGTGTAYNVVIPKFDAKATNSGQTAVPTNWVVSFTGSTGGQTNIHELATLKICADTMYNPTGEGAYGFSCLEPGTNNPWVASARPALYTKLINTPFTMDVAALDIDGNLEGGYVNSWSGNKYLRLELWDANSGTCSAYSGTPLYTQVLTIPSNNTTGRITTPSISIPKASPRVMCRIRECTNSSCSAYTGTPACSADQFTVRPLNFTNVTSTANGDLTGVSSTTTTTVKTGALFSISVDTNAPGYNGTPSIDNTKKEWLNAPSGGVSTASPTFGTGSLTGTFNTATQATGNGATGNFAYDEVGYFRFQTGGIYDNSWTSSSNDSSNNDCVVGSSSNVLSGGKYGCNISTTTVSNHIGRFIPDRLTPTLPNLYNRTDVCPLGCGNFTYLNEPLSLQWTLTAQNSTGMTTKNYSGSFARLALNLANVNNLNIKGVTSAGPTGTTFVPGGRLTTQSVTGSWAGGVASNIVAGVTPNYLLSGSNVAVDGPFLTAFGVAPVDADNVTLAPSALNLDTEIAAGNERYLIGTTNLRFGQLYLGNVSGTNTRDLRVPIQTRYWNGSSWVINADDNATSFPLGSLTFARYSLDMNSSSTNVLPAASQLTMIAGVGYIGIQKPSTGRGSFDIGINLNNRNGANLGKWTGPAWNSGPGDSATASANIPYLSNNMGSSNYTNDPAARITFGVYRTTDKIIDIREQY